MNISIKKLLVMGSWLLVAVPSFLPAQQVVTTQQAERNYKYALANYVKHPTIRHAQQLERDYNLLAQSPQRKREICTTVAREIYFFCLTKPEVIADLHIKCTIRII